MTPPSISGGTTQGQTLSATPGSWTNSPTSYTYQWQRCTTGSSCANIGVATSSSTYVSQQADVADRVQVVVTAYNATGSGTATSLAVGPIVGSPPPPPPTPVPPANTTGPSISGTPQQGSTLAANPGSWSGDTPMSFDYNWSDGATGKTDTLTAADVGQNITVTVTASNDAGSAKATSQPVGPVQAAPPPPPTTSGLHVSGNKLVGANGAVVRLHGVNYSGTEYSCVQGYGVFDGNTPTQADVTNLLAAHVNDVRIPMNEDCWLGINGISGPYAGANYQSAIKNWVALLEANGITPILELHWSAPGSQRATGQEPMPDADHSVAFWQGVAGTFGSDNRVIFDLYNEPYPSSWTCWRDGGAACNGDVPFQVAGMQTLVNAIRAAGASNVIMLGCLDYSNTCDGYGGSWSAYRPIDPANNLAASVHVYLGNPCINAACWNKEWLPILQAGSPVIDGEWGSYDYNGAGYSEAFGTSLLDWFDQNGASGYTAWTWNNWNLWSTGAAEPLIQADDGSVLSTWGRFMSAQYAQRFP